MATKSRTAAEIINNLGPEPLVAEACCSYDGFDLYALAWKSKLLHFTFSPTAHGVIKRKLQDSCPAVPIYISYRLQTEILERFELYAKGRQKRFSHPAHFLLAASGTLFQQRVWHLLGRIPYAETATYGQLARKLGNSGWARAVGTACHANPLVLIFPCHRVIASNGPGGFNGGSEVKERLLAMERGFCS